MANGKTRIRVKGLSKIYGREPERVLAPELKSKTKAEILQETGCVCALKDVNFDVDEGEIFMVMGLSGSGKSTLVRCLIRLLEPTSGQVWIEGEDVLKYNQKQLIELRRNKTSMVFQHFGLLPHRSVLDNASWGLEIKGMNRKERQERAMEVLQKVGLGDRTHAFTGELSGGMQQRVGLARALASDPDILLMDEPFSALDPLICRSMQDELLRLQHEMRKTLVFITHDLEKALRLGDRIALMRDGEFIQIGTPQEIVALPADEYVGEFIRGISKAKLLGASSIMRQPEPSEREEIDSYACCSPDTPISDLVAMAAETAKPIAVTDDGRLLGVVPITAILNRIAEDQKAQTEQLATSRLLKKGFYGRETTW